jgi:hypothetical protein
MESTVFRQWLAEQGCRFDSHEQHGRSHGHPQVVVHCGKRSSRLDLLGPHQRLDAREIRRVCDELGLDPARLPGPQSRT